MTRYLTWLALGCLIITSACSTAYTPRRTAQARLVQKAGSSAVMLNGQMHELGPFMGGADRIFEPGTEAHKFGEKAQLASDIGTGLYVAGLATLVAGPLMLQSAELENDGDARFSTFMGTSLAGLVVTMVGISFVQKAVLSLWDAVNVHNDETWEANVRPTQQPPPDEPTNAGSDDS